MLKISKITYTNLIILCVILSFSQHSLFADPDTRDGSDAPLIKVALGLDLSNTKVTLTNGGSVTDMIKGKQIASFSKTVTLNFQLKKEKIQIDGINGEYTSLLIKASQSSSVEFNDRAYRGTIRVIARKTGIWVLNDVSMEEYLYGVVPFEVPMSWNLEAVKAQAVAARTYAVRCLNQYDHGEYDVYDSVKDQVYRGIDGEKPKSIDAVDSTRGIILSYQGWPIKAYYCADAGGQTERSKFVFTQDLPYLQSVESKDNLEGHRWNFLISKDELTTVFNKPSRKLGKILDLAITSVSPSGRPGMIQVTGSESTIELTSNDFRKAIGAGRVRSTLFTIVGNNDETSNLVSPINIRSVALDSAVDNIKCISSEGIHETDSLNVSITGDVATTVDSLKSKTAITAQMGQIYMPKEDIKPSEDEFLFVGSGYGHGVGMSQWGAKAYADSGWDYKHILLHYYRGAELTIWY